MSLRERRAFLEFLVFIAWPVWAGSGRLGSRITRIRPARLSIDIRTRATTIRALGRMSITMWQRAATTITRACMNTITSRLASITTTQEFTNTTT